MAKKDLPKGFACETCNKWHDYGMYVYAHWTDILRHQCDNCGAEHSIVKGQAWLKKKGRVPKASAA
jgi:transcription elongation factor Elf1